VEDRTNQEVYNILKGGVKDGKDKNIYEDMSMVDVALKNFRRKLKSQIRL